jgi:hypothetical protein
MNYSARGCMYCEGVCNKECLPKQERSYNEEEVKDIMAETWIRCVGNDGNDFKETRDKILELFKNK